MSHTLTQIEEAEKRATKINEATGKKAHQIIITAEEKSHALMAQHKELLHKKQQEALVKYKEVCSKKFKSAEKEMTSALLVSQKKWEGNIKKGVDFLVQAFQKNFS